ncbi:conserved hypothetical protein [Pediculus humanus corporis]|uniref:C2 domain-containing protein n=1 Tax=Pediculus humanus subsp. corporis TaxID=121224 RepID=E0VQX2_PEDHC|nr:uncharacterized protein Phum_PHUM388330 [Pediculus humanus corporis]EEB15778.1 conserved hypothetical protein [Pediculus humanus corporis]
MVANERERLHRHISKSAADLPEEIQKEEITPQASSVPSNFAQSVPQLTVAQKTHNFFSTLRNRWCKNKERKKRRLGDDFIQKDGASTDYAADNSSDHSSSATQSPQHRIKAGSHASESNKLLLNAPTSTSLPFENALPTLPLFMTSSECRKRESILRQHSFFQLRVHLKRGVDLIARDKGGTSDPYVKFKVGGRLLYKSKTIYRDLNPYWDETFTIPIEDAFAPVHIKSEKIVKVAGCNEVVMFKHCNEIKYFQKSNKIGEVNRRLKSQIWSSVVTIVLVEGKKLQKVDVDDYCDVFVKFRLGSEKYKSKIAFKTSNPSWLEQFDLHLYDDQNQELEVTIWHKDKSRDEFLGRCTIDLSLLDREKTHGLWQELEEGDGTIHLLLTISGTTASETISDLTTYEENSRERKNIEKRYALRNSFHNLRDVGHLTVKVYRATGLAAADLGGKSDPFCVLELVNARLQTQTEYKTLSPSWQKIFTFNVKDINSVLEVTVFDEDRDHKVEFLGKVSIPLLRIHNGEKKWYCLKDKKLHGRAKGNCPMILLEMHVLWNPIRACIRTLNPKECKYMQGETKFKRQIFVKNVLRLKQIIMVIIDWGKMIQDCFEWESPAQSAFALVFFVGICYYFEPYMIPVALIIIFLKQYMVLWLTGGKCVDNIDDVIGDEDDDDDEKDKAKKKSLKERLQAIQEVTQTVQNAIGFIASLGEQIKNTFNFTVPFLSYLAIGLTLIATIVLYYVPVRYLIMMIGVNRFSRKLLRPHTIPNNEILDLLSRVPDDEDLVRYYNLLKYLETFKELRPYTSGEMDKRRDQRKKIKS